MRRFLPIPVFAITCIPVVQLYWLLLPATKVNYQST